MPFVYNPIYVLGMLSLMVILSIYIGKTKLGKQFGAALLVILFTAVIANLKLIPSASDSIGLYDVIFQYIAPISIFYLLLNVNLNSIKKAGLPMISLFIIGSLATTLGIFISWVILSPENILGEDAKIIAGMLTGTYTGGSVNFNAIAIEYGFQKKGVLYAGTIAVDNVVTAVWILVTLVLPMFLSKIWKSKIEHNKISNEQVKISDKGIDLISLAWLTFLGIMSFYLSEILVQYFPRIPSILILSTFGIGLAQTKFVSNLKGGHDLGLYLVYLFLAVIGAYCEIGAVYQLKEIGFTLLLFTTLAVSFHGILTIIIGGLVYRDWQMIAIVSQANVGGGASAIALAETFNRKELILPAILVGTLGNALGTYLGFFVVYVL
tara:strand:+ start:864 stop:2000 length:1137 start_codon:yes stop_codon:yes gene_type:complete